VLLLDFKADIYQEAIDTALTKVDTFLVKHLPYLLEQLYYERNYKRSSGTDLANVAHGAAAGEEREDNNG
ncbi:unnamed protein product, partial [Amoebophrya sp. A25]